MNAEKTLIAVLMALEVIIELIALVVMCLK